MVGLSRVAFRVTLICLFEGWKADRCNEDVSCQWLPHYKILWCRPGLRLRPCWNVSRRDTQDPFSRITTGHGNMFNQERERPKTRLSVNAEQFTRAVPWDKLNPIKNNEIAHQFMWTLIPNVEEARLLSACTNGVCTSFCQPVVLLSRYISGKNSQSPC